ncbi:hypothetical protein [Methylobacterium platani]|uniref:Uncharacterized protein n=2 Tax=Methylobacterium platani TaxID=427683 RepID=A0A179SAP5_9HYPH|nr:hypothetical protein [Methylobacterium platani]KMO14737.1 hypothetical protein SQ03_18795 [Methylobacterium platani JCM 14648]OAS23928.1 hypothetical protein A5481_15890 [Methylobacterium platani]
MHENDITMLSSDQIAAEVARANATMEALRASGQNHSAWMRSAFQGADIVFGYWQDQMAPRGGVRRALLKGRDRLLLISQGMEAIPQRMLYVHSS